jgi:hypothetical protein
MSQNSLNNAKAIFRKKLGKQPLEEGINVALRFVKEGKTTEALQYVLGQLPKKDRVKYVCDIFYKSRYRSYTTGIQRFKEAMDCYLLDNNIAKMTTYSIEMEEQLKVNHYSLGHSEFNAIRKSIIIDVLSPQESTHGIFLALLFILEKKEHYLGLDQDKELKQHLGNLINLKWPGHPGIKLLFGSR